MPLEPTTIFSGTTGPKGDRVGPDRIITRILTYVVLVLLFPLTFAVYGLWMALFMYARTPWWVPAPVATFFWVVMLWVNGGIVGAFSGHLNMWVGIVNGVRSEEGLAGAVAGNWLDWLLGQFWFAGAIGSSIAAVFIAWKWMRRPRWEERDLKPGPILKNRYKKTAELIESGKDAPEDGVTVGVAIDLRDPRFAGGHPGAPYGTRAVLLDSESAGHVLVVGGSGSGKALALDTPIPTPEGFKLMGDLQVGDVVFGSDGNPVTVTQAHNVMVEHDCYAVVFDDGSGIIADGEHLWTVTVGSVIETVNTENIYSGLAEGKTYSIPSAGVVQYPTRELPVDPYEFGRSVGESSVKLAHGVGIPSEYLFSSETQRREFLNGLFDDSDFSGKAFVSVVLQDELIAQQIVSLVDSLGYRGSYIRNGSMLTLNVHLNAECVRIVAVSPVSSVPVRCIAVDSHDHLFLAGRTYVPTHNTTTMLIGMRDVIRRGNGLIVVDCKGGPDVPDQLAEWAERYGRKFYHWSIHDVRTKYDGPADSPAFYDPISRGDPSRRKDLLIGSQRWDVEYYKTVISDYLQTAFSVMALVPPSKPTDTFKDLADLLSPASLLRRASSIPRERFPELAFNLERISEMGDQERSGVNNMYARLNTITSSTAGAWLRKDPEGLHDIDLLRAAHEGEVVVFSLDSSNYEETSALLAGLIVQDLKTVTSSLRENPASTPVHVYIDEFSAVDATNIYGLLAKARDAKMPVTLATQALADLKRRDPYFDSAVVGIVSSFLIHRANKEDDARIYAGLTGLTKKMIHRMGVENSTGTLGTIGAASGTGSGFLEEKETYRVDVGVFQHLKQGQCVMIAKIPVDRYISPVQVIRENLAKAEMYGDAPLEPERYPMKEEYYEAQELFPAQDALQEVVENPVNTAGRTFGMGGLSREEVEGMHLLSGAAGDNGPHAAPLEVTGEPLKKVGPKRPGVSSPPVNDNTIEEENEAVKDKGKKAGAPLPLLPTQGPMRGDDPASNSSSPPISRDISDEWSTI